VSIARRGGAVLGVGVLASVVAISCVGPSGDASPGAITLGHVGAPGSLYEVASREFADRANARLPVGWTVEVYGSSQLGNDEVMLQKLRLGTLDLSIPSTVMSSVVEAFGLFEMPYLVRDREHMRAIEREVVWPVLAPLAAERGYRLIAVWENGFRHVTNNVRPIVTPDDLRGVKLRTPRGVWRVKLFQAMGANPTPMAFSEVFVALQTGVMDGQENPLMQIRSARFHEVQDFLSLTGHVYSPAFVVAGASWDRMPEDVRGILQEEARATQSSVYERAAEIDATILAELGQGDIQVNEVEREAFLEASEAVYDEFATTVEGGADLLERARGLSTEAGP
jgi:tripartite ATP-independent transporter DctP family solute receptor